MQTFGSQSRKTGQEVASSSARGDTALFSRIIQSDNLFRLLLSIAVFYPFALFLTLFAGVFMSRVPATPKGITGAAVVLLVTVFFLIVSYRLISMLLRERIRFRKELSRARRLAQIADVLNGGFAATREKMKQAGRLLWEEGEKEGWRCRIVVHENVSFLPPAGGRMGFHIPLAVDGQKVGTLIVTVDPNKFDSLDRAFFASLSRTLAAFIHKEKLWDDFHADMKRLQASLLLHVETDPQGALPIKPSDHRTVEYMLKILGSVKGK